MKIARRVFAEEVQTYALCRRVPMHFTRKSQETIFVGNFMENIFCQITFFLENAFFLEKTRKTNFREVQAPKKATSREGGGRVFWSNEGITINTSML